LKKKAAGASQARRREARVIHRVGPAGAAPGPAYADPRLRLLKDGLHQNSEVSFRYRGSRHVGRVLELLPKAVLIEFRLQRAERVEHVGYGSILRVLEP
jgi:hypothetical protein